eukprot:gene61689-84368_t
MPHLIVEYSRNLAGFPEAQALAELNAAVCASPEVADEADLKSRIAPVQQFEVGTAPANRAFVHAQLRLLSGRTPEAKKDLSEGSPRFQCNNWRYANPALARGW